MVIDAAQKGLSVALGCPNLLRHEIRNGSLVAPLGGSASAGSGYHLIVSTTLRDVDSISEIRSWAISDGGTPQANLALAIE